MQVNRSAPGSSPLPSAQRRPTEPAAAGDPVDTCTLSHPSESSCKMQRALATSNYRDQLQITQGLLEKARNNELLSADEQAALRDVITRPQANGSVQVAAFLKSEESLGVVKLYKKTEVG